MRLNYFHFELKKNKIKCGVYKLSYFINRLSWKNEVYHCQEKTISERDTLWPKPWSYGNFWQKKEMASNYFWKTDEFQCGV